MDGIRLRGKSSFPQEIKNRHIKKFGQNSFSQSQNLPSWIAGLLLLFLISLFLLIWRLDERMPQALEIKDEISHQGQFIAERAYRHLVRLTSFGPRPTGSYANEILAVEFFGRELSFIKQRANTIHRLDIDVQKTTGHFYLNFIDGLTSYYANIQNVVARLSPRNSTETRSLLVNCHFDSVPGSPGASDDGVSCAVMLEVLQVLSQREEALPFPVVFLFNGAEENLLQATHGFITRHMWGRDVQAFVNLEACGAGGRELVFQAGPQHAWLIQVYADVAPHPFASVVGQEIFQSGLVPSDTDFRIFRDFGHVPGLDIAYIRNGYVYHTRYDDVSRIPIGSIQRAGDNLVALVKRLASGPELADLAAYEKGDMIFYDVVGLFMIIYPAHMGQFINIVVVLVSVICTMKSSNIAIKAGLPRSTYCWLLMVAVLTSLSAWAVGLGLNLLTAAVVTFLQCNMAWFTYNYWIFSLYVCPMILGMIVTVNVLVQLYFQKYVTDLRLVEELLFEGVRLIAAVVCFGLTCKGIRSAFLLVAWQLYPGAGRFVSRKLFGLKEKGGWWVLLQMAFLTVPIFLTLYLSWNLFVLFIPVMGRIGASNNPDVALGFLAWGVLLWIAAYIIPWIVLLEKPHRVFVVLFMLTGISLLLILLTPLGFPYSADPQSPTPQRALVHHVDRVFRDANGNVRHQDSGFWILNVDYNSPRLLLPHVPGLAAAKQVKEECEQELYCGFPHYYPALRLLRVSHWIQGPSPIIHEPANLQMISQRTLSLNVRRLTFNVTGPDHMGLFLSPAEGVELVGWPFTDEIPTTWLTMQGRSMYFVYYSHGLPAGSWNFWFDLKSQEHSKTNGILDIAVAGHYLHGEAQMSPDFKTFLSYFPNWSYPLPVTSTYQSWRF